MCVDMDNKSLDVKRYGHGQKKYEKCEKIVVPEHRIVNYVDKFICTVLCGHIILNIQS